MLEASDKAGPMEQDPQMKPALDGFRELAAVAKPMSLEELTKRADFLKSQLPADVLERIQTRSKVAKAAKARYWAETTT